MHLQLRLRWVVLQSKWRHNSFLFISINASSAVTKMDKTVFFRSDPFHNFIAVLQASNEEKNRRRQYSSFLPANIFYSL